MSFTCWPHANVYGHINTIIISVINFQAYEHEVRTKGTGMNRSLHRLFDTLAGRGTTAYTGKFLFYCRHVPMCRSYIIGLIADGYLLCYSNA